jgi:cytochrome P450
MQLAGIAAPPGVPFFGNLLQLDPQRAHLVLEDFALRLGTPYRMRLRKRDMLVVSDPAAISEILRARPGAFRRGRPVESVFAEMGIAGVFSAEGRDWERQRRLVMRAFDPARLRGYFPALAAVTGRLLRRWSAAAARGAELDIQAELMRYTVDVTAGLAFGTETNTLERDDDLIQRHLEQVFPMLSRRMSAPFPWWRHFRLPADRALERNLAAIRAAIDGFIAQARARLAADPARREKPANLIEALLAARDLPESGFSDRDVSGNVFTALLAGEDTTANTLAWLCHFLAGDPGAQDAMWREADAVLGSSPVLTDFARVQDLPYLDAAAREAMRLKPVAPLLFFESNEAARVGEVEIGPKTPVAALMRPAGLDPALFPDPLGFRPERWIGGDAEQLKAAQRVLMPFGGGPRFCPGRYLALLEIRMVASMLARNFTLHRCAGEVRERYNLSMMPVGLRIRLEARAGLASGSSSGGAGRGAPLVPS